MKNKIICYFLIITSTIVLLFILTGCGTQSTNEALNEEDNDKIIENNIGENNLISQTDSYVGYYADMNADGEVDGVIYADLAIGKSGTWNSSSEYAYLNNYSYDAITSDLKEYYVSGTYTGDSKLGIKSEIISPVSDSTGEDRFYVMALEDFQTEDYTEFYWYYNASGKLNTSNNVDLSVNDFGDGKANTIKWIEAWNNSTYGEQTTTSSGKLYIDSLGAIQNRTYDLVTSVDDSGKWFIPSKSELLAFADYLFTNFEFKELQNDYGSYYGGFSDFGLSILYISSNQKDAYSLRDVDLQRGCVNYTSISTSSYVRLSATF